MQKSLTFQPGLGVWVIGVWRAMMRRILSAISLACIVAALGCQSWSQVGQGFPSNSRVAPPGTGTYNVPSNYYNGPKPGTVSAGPGNANSGVMPASHSTAGRTAGFPQSQTPNEVSPAAYQVPTVDQMRAGINNSASAVLNDMSNRANQAIQNGTARAASTVQQYTTPVFKTPRPSLLGRTDNQLRPAVNRSAMPRRWRPVKQAHPNWIGKHHAKLAAFDR